MNHLYSKLTLIFCLLLMEFGYCQTSAKRDEPVDVDKQFEEALRAKMKKDRELIESLMNDDLFKKFDQMFEQMTRDFEQGHFESLQKFFERSQFDNFLDQSGLFDGLGLGEGKWVENREERILVLKIALGKEEPLNIEIKDSKVKVSGQVSVTRKNPIPGAGPGEIVSKRKIEQSYLIPDDVDATRPKFENKEGSLLIRFRKLSAGAAVEKAPERQPLVPKDGDITI